MSIVHVSGHAVALVSHLNSSTTKELVSFCIPQKSEKWSLTQSHRCLVQDSVSFAQVLGDNVVVFGGSFIQSFSVNDDGLLNLMHQCKSPRCPTWTPYQGQSYCMMQQLCLKYGGVFPEMIFRTMEVRQYRKTLDLPSWRAAFDNPQMLKDLEKYRQEELSNPLKQSFKDDSLLWRFFSRLERICSIDLSFSFVVKTNSTSYLMVGDGSTGDIFRVCLTDRMLTSYVDTIPQAAHNIMGIGLDERMTFEWFDYSQFVDGAESDSLAKKGRFLPSMSAFRTVILDLDSQGTFYDSEAFPELRNFITLFVHFNSAESTVAFVHSQGVLLISSSSRAVISEYNVGGKKVIRSVSMCGRYLFLDVGDGDVVCLHVEDRIVEKGSLSFGVDISSICALSASAIVLCANGSVHTVIQGKKGIQTSGPGSSIPTSRDTVVKKSFMNRLSDDTIIVSLWGDGVYAYTPSTCSWSRLRLFLESSDLSSSFVRLSPIDFGPESESFVVAFVGEKDGNMVHASNVIFVDDANGQSCAVRSVRLNGDISCMSPSFSLSSSVTDGVVVGNGNSVLSVFQLPSKLTEFSVDGTRIGGQVIGAEVLSVHPSIHLLRASGQRPMLPVVDIPVFRAPIVVIQNPPFYHTASAMPSVAPVAHSAASGSNVGRRASKPSFGSSEHLDDDEAKEAHAEDAKATSILQHSNASPIPDFSNLTPFACVLDGDLRMISSYRDFGDSERVVSCVRLGSHAVAVSSAAHFVPISAPVILSTAQSPSSAPSSTVPIPHQPAVVSYLRILVMSCSETAHSVVADAPLSPAIIPSLVQSDKLTFRLPHSRFPIENLCAWSENHLLASVGTDILLFHVRPENHSLLLSSRTQSAVPSKITCLSCFGSTLFCGTTADGLHTFTYSAEFSAFVLRGRHVSSGFSKQIVSCVAIAEDSVFVVDGTGSVFVVKCSFNAVDEPMSVVSQVFLSSSFVSSVSFAPYDGRIHIGTETGSLIAGKCIPSLQHVELLEKIEYRCLEFLYPSFGPRSASLSTGRMLKRKASVFCDWIVHVWGCGQDAREFMFDGLTDSEVQFVKSFCRLTDQ
eukprot:ANDGO_05036.mRNA.1 hypothetical protein